MKLKLGISPCPNDCFIFYALIRQKIDTGRYDFDICFEDVESLNQQARQSKLDITKLSFNAYAHVSNEYQILDSGSALGRACGPLLISKKKVDPEDISHFKIAIPGKLTTANLLLSIAFPKATNKLEMIFSEIEDSVLSGKTELGLIIHENRFTYEEKGLQKVMDLGEYWETQTSLPIPLGAIAVKRSFHQQTKQDIDMLIRESISYARQHEQEALAFAKLYAQEMDEDIMLQHIHLYVNDFTVQLGAAGKNAITTLYNITREKLDYPEIHPEIFANS